MHAHIASVLIPMDAHAEARGRDQVSSHLVHFLPISRNGHSPKSFLWEMSFEAKIWWVGGTLCH